MRASACCSRAVCRPSEQHLDDADVDVLLEQMGGEAVPQGVQRDALVDVRHLGGGVAGAIELARGHWLGRIAAREQPTLRPRRPHQVRSRSSRLGESMTLRSLPPLPCSTRMIMRLLSMSETLSETTSVARRPAP